MSSVRATEPGLRPGLPVALTTLGWGCILGGGLVAAVTDPLDVPRGSWLAAYLVLVGGVTQCAMGRDRTTYSRRASTREGWAQLASWNLGNVAIIGGTLAELPLLVYVGSALLVLALALAWRATRVGGSGAASVASANVASTGAANLAWDRAWRWGYPALLVLLAVSIPVGMVLSTVRNS